MNLRDVRIEYFKSSGPGGQHKNKRNMAVRVLHLPSGLSAVGQEQRSQAQNKELAFERLRAKLKEKYRTVKPRIATKHTRSSKARRLERKKRHSIKKISRKQIDKEDYDA